MNLEHVYNHSAIKPELVIVGHGSNDIISLTVEPGRPLNVVCESHRVHVGDVGWTNLGEKEVCLVTIVITTFLHLKMGVKFQGRRLLQAFLT